VDTGLSWAAAGFLAAGTAVLDEAASAEERFAAQVVVLVGLLERPLDGFVVGSGDGDGNAEGQVASLDGEQEAVLAAGQELEDAADVADVEIDFAGDFGVAVAAVLEGANLAEQLDGQVFPAGKVLDQAHEQKLLVGAFHEDGRYLLLAERYVGFQPSLAAHEHIAGVAVFACDQGDRYRPLEAEFGNVGGDLGELLLAPVTRVEHLDLADGNVADRGIVTYGHADSSILRRLDRVAR
jgi:hypothetical protein